MEWQANDRSSGKRSVPEVLPVPIVYSECSDADSSDSDWACDGDTATVQQHQHANQIYMLEHMLEREGTWSGIRSYREDSRYNVDFDTIAPELQLQLHSIPLTLDRARRSSAQVMYRGILIARKTILNSQKSSSSILRREIDAGKALSGIQHVISLVGTYSTNRGELSHILTFPVASCNLDQFLDDCEAIHRRRMMPSVENTVSTFGYPTPRSSGLLQKPRDELSDRLKVLELPTFWSGNAEEALDSVKWRLNEIMGCLTQAICWMHAHNVEHCDLKPSNILLRPNQIYITDFGISTTWPQNSSLTRDPRDRDPYTALELCNSKPKVPFAADIYSLGCIFMHMLTVIYYRPKDCCRQSCTETLSREPINLEGGISSYIKYTLNLPEDREVNKRRTYVGRKGHHPFTTQMLTPLLSLDPKTRPSAKSINATLWTYGGMGRLYHGPCCSGTLKVQTLEDTPGGEPRWVYRTSDEVGGSGGC